MRSEYRILQDDMTVASSTSLYEILHYARVYVQDGPVEIQHRVNGKWRALERGVPHA